MESASGHHRPDRGHWETTGPAASSAGPGRGPATRRGRADRLTIEIPPATGEPAGALPA
jgi:hypothetical protein